MRGRIDWRWVGDWVRRVFAITFPLTMFVYLAAFPALGDDPLTPFIEAALFGLAVAALATLIAAALLAWTSARQGGRPR